MFSELCWGTKMTKCEHCGAPVGDGQKCPFCGVLYPLAFVRTEDLVLAMDQAWEGGETSTSTAASSSAWHYSEEQFFSDHLDTFRDTVKDFGNAVGKALAPAFDVMAKMVRRDIER